MKPYTYYIRWTALGKSYYGVKYGQDANPETFWVDYHTSSKYVKALREEYGDPDIIQVRRTFTSREAALRWEKTVLKRIGAILREDYLNLSIFGGDAGVRRSKETRRRMSESQKGKVLSREIRRKISEGNKGKIISEAQREAISKANKVKKGPRSAETRQKIGESNKRPITIYSTLQDKSYYFESINELRDTLRIDGISLTKLRNNQPWHIKTRFKKTKHPFSVGDVILFTDSTS